MMISQTARLQFYRHLQIRGKIHIDADGLSRRPLGLLDQGAFSLTAVPLTHTEMAAAQMSDPFVKPIIDHLRGITSHASQRTHVQRV